MSADGYTYRTHLTPRGWEKGSRPSDALETWEVKVERRQAPEPVRSYPRRVRTNPQTSPQNPNDLERARKNHGERPRT